MNGNDQIIGNKQGTTHRLSGQSLMRASKGVITAGMMMLMLMLMLMMPLLIKMLMLILILMMLNQHC